MIEKKKYFIIFLIITFLQVIIIVFWGTRKENLYWDEFYTLERAHYYSSFNSSDHYIDEDSDFKVGEWMPISFIKKTLIVSEDETLLNEPFFEVIKKLANVHNYSAYLNLIESVISIGKFSIWPSIILNIIFMIFNQIILFKMCQKLSTDKTYALAVCAMYGFSSMCISMTIFIRFYMLVALLVTIFTYIHLKYFDQNDDNLLAHVKRLVMMIISFGVLYLAHQNAQYTVIYGGIFVIAFAIFLLIEKGLKRFLYYSVPMFGCGLIYLYTQTNYLKILFNFKEEYGQASAALANTLDGITEFKLSFFPSRIRDMVFIWGKYIFGSFFAMVIFFIILMAIIIIKKARNIPENKEKVIHSTICIPSVAAVLYIVIFTAFGLYEQVRYISFVFPELIAMIIAVIYINVRNDKTRYTLLTALVIVMILSVNIKSKVDMLYMGDRKSIETVQSLDIDSYILMAGNHITFMAYETAYVAQENADFFVVTDDKKTIEKLENKLRDNMIIVGYYGVSTQQLQDFLKSKGYKVEWVADTYNNVFFSAVRE